jgi:thymidylate synthase
MLKTILSNHYASVNKTHEEYQYLEMVREVLNTGEYTNTRNGSTYMKYGGAMYFSLKDGKIPLLTTKRVAWKTCFKELLWFLSGSTDNDILQKQGVHIWDDNSTREFLDLTGLTNLEEGDLGAVYGHQWRHFNADYSDRYTDYSGKGVDQLQYVVDCLKDPEKRTSRRIIMSAWNPCQLSDMALPPCHVLVQFNVNGGNKLSCSMYQRSCDLGLGVPFNIASYSCLTHLLAKHCGLIADEFIYYMGNVHIYEGHVDGLRQQIERIPLPFPSINISCNREKIEGFEIVDIEITGYEHYKAIKMKMVA